MSRVFAVQIPARREGNKWVEKFDLSAAEHFGRVIRVLPYGNVPSDPEPTKQRLREAFCDFDFEKDYVLLLGDPVAIAQAVAVLIDQMYDQEYSGRLMVLKWDRRESRYEPYCVG